MAVDEYDKAFQAGCKYLQERGDELRLCNDDKLFFYAHFKQVQVGKCNTAAPAFWDFTGKAKWNAWNSLGDMNADEARKQYVSKLTALKPDWRDCLETSSASSSFSSSSSNPGDDDDDEEDNDGASSSDQSSKGQGGGGMGPVFSRMVFDDDDGGVEPDEDGERGIWQLASGGELAELKKALKEKESDLIQQKDSDGLTVLHWAVDGDQPEVLSFLLGVAGIDVNVVDGQGQTALHYAALCNNEEMVKQLLEAGADASIKDEDGTIPEDATTDDGVQKLLCSARTSSSSSSSSS